ncbi:hypothetical protein JCM11641_004764 [Rhodosporidiobolus odoratus]
MARTQRRVDPSSDEGENTDYDNPSARRKSTQGAKNKSAAARDKGGKGKKRKQRDESSDEMTEDSDEEGAAAKKGKELSEDEKKHYIQGIVRFVLFREMSHRQVIKRQDIIAAVFADGKGKHFNSLFPKVQKVLREVMGMELFQLRGKEGNTAKSTVKTWILRSLIPTPLIRAATTTASPSFATPATYSREQRKKSTKNELLDYEQDEELLPDESDEEEMGVMRDVKREEGAAYGILGVVLALILVNGKVLADDQLISLLRRLSLVPSSPVPLTLAHPPASTTLTLSAYLNLLLKEHYLERVKTQGGGGATQGGGGGRGATQGPNRTQRATADGGVAETGDPTVEWRWGARADAEIGELGVAKFIERIFHAETLGRRPDADEEEEGVSQSQGGGGKRGKTGERFLKEVARSAGVKQLQSAEDAKANKED